MITPVLAIVGNVFSAVALILTNKRIVVVENFRFMSLLTGLHFYFSFVICCFLLMMGVFQYKAVNNYSSLLKICVGSLASIVLMNLNLMTNSVGFYQLSKLSCIPITLIIETILNRRQQTLSFIMVLSLSLILGGMSFIVINELSLNAIGLIWASLAVVATSLAQVLFGPLQKDLGMNSIQLLFHTSPILTIGSYFLIPLFEDTKKLLMTDITSSLVGHILASCVMAVMLNITNYFVLSITSPLTYQILNHCKTIMVILFGIVFFDEYPSHRVTIGMSLVVIGVIVYSEENRRQQLNRAQGKGRPESIASSHIDNAGNRRLSDTNVYFPKARNSDSNFTTEDTAPEPPGQSSLMNSNNFNDNRYITAVGAPAIPALSRGSSNSVALDMPLDDTSFHGTSSSYVTCKEELNSG